MGIRSHVVAVGIGYALGRAGPARLAQLAADVGRRPEVRQLRERGWDLAGDWALGVKRRVEARSRATASDDAGAGAGAGRTRPPRSRAWRRLRFSRAGTVHFPPSDSSGGAPVEFSGTTVEEDSRAAVLGLSTPRTSDGSAPPVDRA